jgi:DtxR family transcriptional regulator, Mn-dependent transcriptional regulator
MKASSNVEDYLKAVYHLAGEAEAGAASTSAIAEQLGVAAGSVTGMVKRLADQGLVEHVPYYGARLTAAGEEQAIGLIRRHRILELFLVQVLGYTWDRVHAEAERLEHAVSDELIDRMAQVLGFPAADPHGAPIPSSGKTFVDRRYPTLDKLDVGCSAVLRRVRDEDPAALRYLAELNLTPGAELTLTERGPFNGPLYIRVGDQNHIVSPELAQSVQVETVRKAKRQS